MPRPVVSIDCDDLLLDFTGEFFLWYERAYGVKVQKRSMKSYRISEVLGVEYEEGQRRIGEFSRTQEYRRLPCIPGAKDLIAALWDEADIVINTARGKSMVAATRDNLLLRFGKEFEQIICVGGLAGKREYPSKAVACMRVDAILHIDDNEDHIRACLTNEPPIPCILYTQPWNKASNGSSGAYRADNHKQTLEHALGILKKAA